MNSAILIINQWTKKKNYCTFIFKIYKTMKYKPYYTYESLPFMSANEGRPNGSYDQQAHIKLYRAGGHPGGRGSLSPFSILPITSLFFTPWNGLMPYMRISHIHTPTI